MKTSVAYLLSQMPAPSEEFLALEVTNLIRSGVEVTVFCLRGPHPQDAKLRVNQGLSDVPIYHFSYILSWNVWSDMTYWLRRHPTILWYMMVLIMRTCWRRPMLGIQSLAILPKSFCIARTIETENIRILHAAWGHHPSITAHLIQQLMPHVHFTLALGAYDRLRKHPMTVVAVKHAACILTQSHASANLIKNHWPKTSKPLFVIARGIDVKTTSSYRREREKPEGLIASVGRLIEGKGHHFVIQAFAKVHSTLPCTRLVIVGEGPYRPKLEQMIARLGLSDCIDLPGHLTQTELFNNMLQSSVVVLASESENLPNTLKEAMSIGIPVVTTPTTGMEELVQDGVTGCIVPMGDHEAIAKKILQILDDQLFANHLSEQAIKHIDKNFDIQQTTRKRKQLYEHLVANGSLPIGHW